MKIFAAVRCPPGYKYDEKSKSCVPKSYSRIARPGYVRIGFGGGKSSSQKMEMVMVTEMEMEMEVTVAMVAMVPVATVVVMVAAVMPVVVTAGKYISNVIYIMSQVG